MQDLDMVSVKDSSQLINGQTFQGLEITQTQKEDLKFPIHHLKVQDLLHQEDLVMQIHSFVSKVLLSRQTGQELTLVQNHASSTDNSISVWHLQPPILSNSSLGLTRTLEIHGKKSTFGTCMQLRAKQVNKIDFLQQFLFPKIQQLTLIQQL